MLHIILLILKIIGIVLACIIGLVLLILGLVLFVSIKYKGTVDFDKKPLYTVKIGWIPGVISVWLTNKDGQNRWFVKVFGFTVKDSAKEETSTEQTEKDKVQSEAENKKEDTKHESDESADTKDKPAEVKAKSADAKDKPAESKEKTAESKDKPAESKEKTAESKDKSTDDKVKSADDKAKSADAKVKSIDAKAKSSDAKVKPAEKQKTTAETKSSTAEVSKPSLEDKWAGIKERILKKLDDVSEKFKALKAKKDKISDIFFSPQGKRTVFKVKVALVKLVKHILPVRLKGSLYFGMGDAYKTASILTYIAVFYPVWSPTFTITPDFQEKVIEGHVEFKGRIRLGYVLWLAVKLILDKNLRTMIKELKSLKG